VPTLATRQLVYIEGRLQTRSWESDDIARWRQDLSRGSRRGRLNHREWRLLQAVTLHLCCAYDDADSRRTFRLW